MQELDFATTAQQNGMEHAVSLIKVISETHDTVEDTCDLYFDVGLLW